MNTRVLIRSGPKPDASFPPTKHASDKIWLQLTHWSQRYSCLKVWTHTHIHTHRPRLDWYTISSPLAFGSGELMIFSQLVEICRQLVESRTVIADTRRNIVVNSSELGFNIASYRSNSYASCSNSSELGFNIVLYRSNSYTTR